MKRRKSTSVGSPGVCPRCGASRPAGCDECPACGQSLCPECGAAVGEHWPSCMACGAQFELLCPECGATVKPRDRVCPRCGTNLEGEPAGLLARPAPAPAASSPAEDGLKAAPACDVCGRHDESLRLAAFPFVFSLLFVTFRRTFAGTWCRKHRNRYWALSTLITAAAGWLGIPFGLLYTPLTLFKLARGGMQPTDQNQHLLQVLAGYKLQLGDVKGATRCLEEILRLRDDEAGRCRVQEIYAQHWPAGHPQAQPAAWPLLAAILGAAAVGVAVGLVDTGAARLFSTLSEEGSSFIVVMLSWVPWVAGLFLGGLAVTQMIESALHRAAVRQMALGIAFAVLAAIVALFGTQQGMALGDAIGLLLSGVAPQTAAEAMFYFSFILTGGQGVYFIDQMQGATARGVIYLVITVAATAYYLAAGVGAARGIVHWNQALAAVRAGGQPPRVRALQRGWLAIAAVFAVAACSLLSVPLSQVLYYGGTAARLNGTLELLQQGQTDQAVAELEALAEEQPDVAPIHTTLAAVYMRQGAFDQAVDALQTSASLNPEWGLNHALLAQIYYRTDRIDLLEDELRQAEALGSEDGQTQQVLGYIYQAMEDWSRAEACYRRAIDLQTDPASVYLDLASLYSDQDRYDEALATCDQALAQGGEATQVSLTHGYVHIRQEDLDGAAQAFDEAVKGTPDDAEIHAALSFLYYLKGQVADALREAEQAVGLDRYNRAAQERLALACQATGDLERAKAAALEAVRLNPKVDTAHYVLGLCYRDTGERDLAVQEFQTFLALYSDRAYVRDWKAETEAYLAEQ
jgi:tetratricopeptide (TPR) repeat protein